MHIETQTKSHSSAPRFRIFLLGSLMSALSACSFVELQPGAQSIIFAPPSDECRTLGNFTGEVKTSTLFIERDLKVIADELQTLAQNEAFRQYGNAIWPSSEVNDGSQSFVILDCQSVNR